MILDFKTVSIRHEDFTKRGQLVDVENIYEKIKEGNYQQQLFLILLSNIKCTDGGSLFISVQNIMVNLYKQVSKKLRIWELLKPKWTTKNFYLEVENITVFFTIIEVMTKIGRAHV